eukprot:s108_g13.t1
MARLLSLLGAWPALLGEAQDVSFPQATLIDGCVYKHARYYSPTSVRTETRTWRECQAACVKSTEIACAYFGFYPDVGTCYLTGADAAFTDYLSHGSYSGPAVCPSRPDFCTTTIVGEYPAAHGEASKQAWKDHVIPNKLACWPKNFKDKKYENCPSMSILEDGPDTETGWPGKCLGLKQVVVPYGETCSSWCTKQVSCSEIKDPDPYKPVLCFQTFWSAARSCYTRTLANGTQDFRFKPTRAQRLMRGEAAEREKIRNLVVGLDCRCVITDFVEIEKEFDCPPLQSMGSHGTEPPRVAKRTQNDLQFGHTEDNTVVKRRRDGEDQLGEMNGPATLQPNQEEEMQVMTLAAQNQELVAHIKKMLENQERLQQKVEEMRRQQEFLITQMMRLQQEIVDMKDTTVEAITSPSGDFVKAVRQATAPVPTKKLPNPALFPEDQRATLEDLRLESRSLPKAVQEALMMPYHTALGFVRSVKIKLTLTAWKNVRGGIAKALKQLRLADSTCKKPLVWSNESNDGPALLRYVWSQSELREYLPKVLDQRVTSAKTETWRQRIEQLIKNDPNPIPWPWHTGKDTSDDDCFPAET